MPKNTSPFRVLLFAALLVALTLPSSAEDWPHWRGPSFDGISSAEKPPTEWNGTKEAMKNVKWRLELPGAAASTPIVVGSRIFLTSTAEESEELLVLAVSDAGKVLWKRTVAAASFDFSGSMEQFKHETNPASPSPVSDGEHLWVLFGNGLLASFDFDGKQIWQRDLTKDYGAFRYYFGLSSSPFVHGQRLFVQVLNTNSQLLLAFDKATGEELWKRERPTDARAECLHSYASPAVYHMGQKDVLVIHGADYVTGHWPEDGTELWRHGGLNPKEGYNPAFRLVATPVFREGLLVVPSAKRGPVYGLRPAAATGEITGAAKHTAWHLERGTPDVPSPLIHDGLVYLSGENGRLTCLDAKTGETLYEERVHQSTHRGSPVAAGGYIYLMGTDGTVSVVKAGREFKLVSKNSVEERTAASLAISGETLYLRSYEALYAIGSTP